ncbi:iron-sulfur cluster assembly scaffold protein [Patescibacteria group bacterium]
MNDFTKYYSEEALKNFQNPKNVGMIEKPDSVGKVGNPVCGDIMVFYLSIEKKKGEDYIKDIKFQTLGCGAAIACSSVLTSLVKGKKIKDAEKISNNKIVDILGDLPPAKIHCSHLATEGLKKAIVNYKNKTS